MARHDVHVHNESDGFVIASMGQRGRRLMPGGAAWNAAVAGCQVLPVSLEREDPVNVRVVVDEALEAAEQAEWVGRIQGGLRVPDGQLALCGGAAYLIDAEPWTEEYARVVPIPAGDYRASVHVYASAPNAVACLESAGIAEPLGAWFRRTRPGQPMPAWLANVLVSEPAQDPGHEREWKGAREKHGAPVVDLLIHLELAAGGELRPAATADDGFGAAVEVRRPEVFPLGLATRELIGRHAGGADDTDAAETPRLPETPATRARTASHHPQPIQGGPVDVPVAKLTRVFRVAWFCHPYTQPEIRIELPQGAKRPAQPEIENVNVAGRGREMAITFENTGQQDGAIEALVPLAKQLAALPDRTVIEIHAARARTLSAGARPVGLHRYRGRVEAGQWRVSEAFPPVDAARLAEAIALAEAAEGGKALRARDEAEAERIEARVMRHAPHAFHSNPLLRNGAELGVKRRDPRALTEVAMRAFWMRYADAWPLQDFDLEPE